MTQCWLFVVAVQVRPDLKPASMATVEAEFEKQPQRSDWQAVRVHRWVVALDTWGHSMHTAKQPVCSPAVNMLFAEKLSMHYVSVAVVHLCRASKAAAGAPKAGGKARGGAAAATAAAAADEPPSMDDLLPRADISGQITGELIGLLGSANWKERKQGLDDVEAILAAAGGRIQPCVSESCGLKAAGGGLVDTPCCKCFWVQASQLLSSCCQGS
jgi:hypothetical protein